MASNRYVLTGVNIAILSWSFQFIYLFRTSWSGIKSSVTSVGPVEIAPRTPECLFFHKSPLVWPLSFSWTLVACKRDKWPCDTAHSKVIFFKELSIRGFSTRFCKQTSTKVSFDPQILWTSMTFWHGQGKEVTVVLQKNWESKFYAFLNSLNSLQTYQEPGKIKTFTTQHIMDGNVGR